jgi:hypothetical protein
MNSLRSISFTATSWGVLAVLVFAGAGSRMALAQQSGANDNTPSFIIGTVSGEPGTPAEIPLYFTPNGGKAIQSAHMEVEFVSNSVKFTKADKGTASAVQDFDLKVDSKELPPDAKNIRRTTLSIDVEVKDPGPKKGLPEGLLSFLDFDVPTNAKPFSIELKPLNVSAEDAAKAPVKVHAEAGKIIIALPDQPLPGCFFFTH